MPCACTYLGNICRNKHVSVLENCYITLSKRRLPVTTGKFKCFWCLESTVSGLCSSAEPLPPKAWLLFSRMCRACPRLYFAALFPDTSVDRELYMQIFLWNTDLRSLIKHHTFKKRQLGVCLAWSLLLLLSHFSRVRLLATPWTAAHQAPRSLGFSRQEHGSGLPCPSPMHKSEKWKWSRSVVSDSSRPHGLQPTRLLRPWDFPGNSTGVGCRCLLRAWSLVTGI